MCQFNFKSVVRIDFHKMYQAVGVEESETESLDVFLMFELHFQKMPS